MIKRPLKVCCYFTSVFLLVSNLSIITLASNKPNTLQKIAPSQNATQQNNANKRNSDQGMNSFHSPSKNEIMTEPASIPSDIPSEYSTEASSQTCTEPSDKTTSKTLSQNDTQETKYRTLDVESIKNSIADLEDDELKEDLLELVNAYVDALDNEKDALEEETDSDTLDSYRDALKTAEKNLIDALKDANISLSKIMTNSSHNKTKTDSVSSNSVSSNSVSSNSATPPKTEKTNSNNFSKSTSITVSKNSNSKNTFLEKIKTIFHTIF